MKMKKLLPLLAAVILIAFNAYGQTNQTPDTSVAALKEAKAVLQNYEVAVTESSGSGRYISDDTRTENIYESTDFSEGRAWVRLGNRGDIIAIIDKQGQLYVALNTDRTPPLGSLYQDGLTFLSGFEGKNKTYNDMIIDRNGDVTFEAEDENFRILGYGDGKFLAARYVTGMMENEWQVGAIDKNGNTVVPFKAYQHEVWGYISNLTFEKNPPQLDEHTVMDCEYIGDGIFRLQLSSSYALLNIETQSTLLNWEDFQSIVLLTGFENGYATALYTDPNTTEHPNRGWVNKSYISKLGTDGSIVKEINNNWVQFILSGYLYTMEFSEGLTFIPFNSGDEGLVYQGFGEDFVYKTGVYYDMNGDVTVELPEYHGKVDYSGGPFKNGYATLLIKGADGQHYLTLIDRDGNQMFEPMQVSDPVRLNYQSFILTDDGYLIVQIQSERDAVCYNIFDINGELVMTFYGPIGKNLGSGINISEGMLTIPNAGLYVNMADGSVIGAYNKSEYSFE